MPPTDHHPETAERPRAARRDAASPGRSANEEAPAARAGSGLQVPILTITVNPALDVTASVPRIVPIDKLRCSAPVYAPGGGGVNVSRAIHELGGTSCALVALGGGMGQHYRELLTALGFDTVIWPIEGETRFSFDVFETVSQQQYRFLLSGPMQPPAAAGALFDEARRQIARIGGLVVISGSLLPGLPTDFAGQLVAATRGNGSRAIVDLSGAALQHALEQRPFLARMNHLEAAELLGLSLAGDVETMAREAARQLVRTGSAENAIVTIGGGGAMLATATSCVHFRPPHVEVVSAVGGGDSFTGAMTLGLARGWALADACRFGVAAAASAVNGKSTELCRRPQTLQFFEQVSAESEDVAG